ncbi:MAG: hypothetical protein EXS16_00620 [Gemmataceae bacterium]|nr:hypothetical protein [Gemmataceae bacterium]
MLNAILHDDHLTRGLDDAEARMLVEWLCEHAEAGDDRAVQALCRRGRLIARFVALWCYEASPSSALQLAATERLAWPLPTGNADACDLMARILTWESAGANRGIGP